MNSGKASKRYEDLQPSSMDQANSSEKQISMEESKNEVKSVRFQTDTKISCNPVDFGEIPVVPPQNS